MYSALDVVAMRACRRSGKAASTGVSESSGAGPPTRAPRPGRRAVAPETRLLRRSPSPATEDWSRVPTSAPTPDFTACVLSTLPRGAADNWSHVPTSAPTPDFTACVLSTLPRAAPRSGGGREGCPFSCCDARETGATTTSRASCNFARFRERLAKRWLRGHYANNGDGAGDTIIRGRAWRFCSWVSIRPGTSDISWFSPCSAYVARARASRCPA
jgi:hypothetical protein